MSSQRLEALRSSYRARANGIVAQLAQAERQELARQDITPAQRDRNVGHLRRQAESRLAQLRAEYQAGQQATLRAIRAPLYRLPPQAMRDVSWRDAMDRASAVESQDDALRLWERAALVDDQIMLTALAYTAAPAPEEHPPKWPQVIARWKASDPGVREALDSYDTAWQELQDKQQQFEDGAMFQVPAAQQPPDTDRLPRLPQLGDSPDAQGQAGDIAPAAS